MFFMTDSSTVSPTTSDLPLTEEARLKRASAVLGVPFVRLHARQVPAEVLTRIPEETARSVHMVAYEEERLPSGRRVLRLAVTDPKALEQEAPASVTDLHTQEGMVIEVGLTLEADLLEILAQYPKAPAAPPAIAAPAPAIPRPPLDQKTTTEPTIDLRDRRIAREILERIPEETAKKYRVVVFEMGPTDRSIHVAVEQPQNPQVQELLAFIKNRNQLAVSVYRATASSIDAALAQYPSAPKSAPIAPQAKGAPATSPAEPKELASSPLRPHLLGGKVSDKEKKHAPAAGEADRPAKSGHGAPRATSKDTQPSALEKLDRAAPSLQSRVPKEAVPVVEAADLPGPDLLVPQAEASPLIPINADVERDIAAVVGREIRSARDLETVIKTGFIPKIVGAILLYAGELAASDVHLQANDDGFIVRYRIDGVLQDVIQMPLTLQAPLVSRIKILAKLKIDEQRIPQDGRFDIQIGSREIDLRVSTFPTVRGEKVAIRLLDKSEGIRQLEDLGLAGSRLDRLQTAIAKPYGVILATGPTGSGKTTTLYAVLSTIAGPAVNVVTLEDPVEYEIPGINQAQIKPKIGFGFAEGLRSVLRQDPNVIMVGEIRDLETASMVTHAALTGHLVLSTLHTNDAAGALPRLIDMGVEPFLITSAMNAVVAQRLVRRLCESCRTPWEPPTEVAEEVRSILQTGQQAELTEPLTAKLSLFKPKGCTKCHDGYRGRIGIFEVLTMTERIEQLTVKKAPASEVHAAAMAEGMITIEQDGLVKVLHGETSLEEVLRVTRAE